MNSPNSIGFNFLNANNSILQKNGFPQMTIYNVTPNFLRTLSVQDSSITEDIKKQRGITPFSNELDERGKDGFAKSTVQSFVVTYAKSENFWLL